MTVLGRLVPHKQVELAIDVVADLSDVLPTLTLDVVGSGYWEPQLREHAAQRGVADRVNFHGFVEESTKHTLLAQSWLMLVPSHKEGWGLIIVEAGLHATPSVAFAEAGGPSESILHGLTGLLSKDYADMRAQARLILQDEGLRGQLGAAARDHAHSFSWWSAAERLEHTLHSVLGHRARPDQPATLGPGSVDLQQVHGPVPVPVIAPGVPAALDVQDVQHVNDIVEDHGTVDDAGTQTADAVDEPAALHR
ncbi:glycosyltransferase [Allobranchiibius sp. GilTou73]|uniref:glycosyltransferase n=1 Tax=Allobranchiibius sp. GilTou73 TaxID=2904523 RepID=UPI001F2A1FF9|nr:glycosyltransferase [Allobranchiibius sp. GilTou73]UIJ36567.1 glycosyltransferase [Allobranchiibius sp. GilTou73]